jgi:hypothetical protein
MAIVLIRNKTQDKGYFKYRVCKETGKFRHSYIVAFAALLSESFMTQTESEMMLRSIILWFKLVVRVIQACEADLCSTRPSGSFVCLQIPGLLRVFVKLRFSLRNHYLPSRNRSACASD